MEKIKIGILGYGNLGRGVENGIKKNEDMELAGIFTRRNPDSLETDSPCFSADDLKNFRDKIDVLILCGGSKSDILNQGPEAAKYFNTVDSFDTHHKIDEYFKKMDEINKKNETVSVISTGWDPGLFSMNRVLADAILPDGETYTFWGKGVSQGHSDAVRRIDGVKNAVQYTIPKEEMLSKIRNGEKVNYSGTNAHIREVFVVPDGSVPREDIKEKIVNMEDYFKGYETIVHFIDEETFKKNHAGIPHGGNLLRLGKTSSENNAVFEFSLKLDSNPEFTSSVDIAFARACYRLSKEKNFGAKTVVDIPISYLSSKDDEYIRKFLI